MLPVETSLQAARSAEPQNECGAKRLNIKPNQNTIKRIAEVL